MMLYEINQIKQWLAQELNLRIEGEGMDLRIIDPVPNGRWTIPLGRSLTPTVVEVRNDLIFIDPDRAAQEMPPL